MACLGLLALCKHSCTVAMTAMVPGSSVLGVVACVSTVYVSLSIMYRTLDTPGINVQYMYVHT